MKYKLSILSLILLFISCSSDDDYVHSDEDSDVIFEERQLRIELTALTENPENYEDISITPFFIGYTEPQLETAIPADSVRGVIPGLIPIEKKFFYSYPELEESINFSTVNPVIGGVFSIDMNMIESLETDEDIYEVKIYHDDELFDVKTISTENGSSYIADTFYLFEPNPL